MAAELPEEVLAVAEAEAEDDDQLNLLKISKKKRHPKTIVSFFHYSILFIQLAYQKRSFPLH